MSSKPAWLVFVAAFSVRVFFLHWFPAIFGGDTILRLANRDRILMAYQLPALQAAIHAVSWATVNVLAVRYLMALAGAAGCAGFYLLLRHFLERRAALCGALLMIASPFLIQLSIVPYQEVPMLAALAWAFHFFFSGRLAPASAMLGLACLTRYEAWVAVPALAWTWLNERGWTPGRILEAALLFGWAPLAWMAAHGAIAPAGTFVVEMPASAWRLQRYVYLGWITVKNTPPPVVAMAALGIAGVWRARHRVGVLAAFFALFLVSVLFSAHGESPDPERYVTARTAALWLAAVVFAAAFTAADRPRLGAALVVAALPWGLWDAHRFLARDTSAPRVQLAYELARRLDELVGEGEVAAVLAQPVAPELAQAYLNKVERRSGSRGLHKARAELAATDTSPPDYQRTLVHSRLGRRRLRPAVAPETRWIAVWSDYSTAPPKGTPVDTIRGGDLRVAIYQFTPAGGGSGPR